LLAFIVS